MMTREKSFIEVYDFWETGETLLLLIKKRRMVLTKSNLYTILSRNQVLFAIKSYKSSLGLSSPSQLIYMRSKTVFAVLVFHLV